MGNSQVAWNGIPLDDAITQAFELRHHCTISTLMHVQEEGLGNVCESYARDIGEDLFIFFKGLLLFSFPQQSFPLSPHLWLHKGVLPKWRNWVSRSYRNLWPREISEHSIRWREPGLSRQIVFSWDLVDVAPGIGESQGLTFS